MRVQQSNTPEKLSPKDRLLSRPETEALPTALDPANPHPSDFPDPRPVAKKGQGDPTAKDPAPTDDERSA